MLLFESRDGEIDFFDSGTLDDGDDFHHGFVLQAAVAIVNVPFVTRSDERYCS